MLRGMPVRAARCLMRDHNVTAPNAVPRLFRKTLPGERAVTSFGRADFQVPIQSFNGCASDRDDAFLVPFPNHVDEAGFEMQLLQANVPQFAEPQAGGIGKFEDGLVAQRVRGGRFFRSEQLVNFSVAQRLGQSFPTTRQRKIFGDVGRKQLFVFGETIQCAQRGDFQVNAFAAQAFGGFPGFIGQRTRAFVLEERHQVFQFHLPPASSGHWPPPR